jgi:hypothetical protein
MHPHFGLNNYRQLQVEPVSVEPPPWAVSYFSSADVAEGAQPLAFFGPEVPGGDVVRR